MIAGEKAKIISSNMDIHISYTINIIQPTWKINYKLFH